MNSNTELNKALSLVIGSQRNTVELYRKFVELQEVLDPNPHLLPNKDLLTFSTGRTDNGGGDKEVVVFMALCPAFSKDELTEIEQHLMQIIARKTVDVDETKQA